VKILVIVPARSGSKGIKNKNIIDVCSKPLLAYSIEHGLALKSLDLVEEVIVSTDSQEIADLSIKYGASVPFIRPKEIANDSAKSVDYCLHAISFFEQKAIFFDSILLLQPTSPIRSPDLLVKAIKLFSKSRANSLLSVFKEEYINKLVMYTSIDGKRLIPKDLNHNKGVRRQQHENILIRNGSIYISKVDYIKNNKRIISDNPLFVMMKKNDSINIDNEEDLNLVRKLLCK
jgi:CMP-N,N'-diacetyllegionaminic acid synthase